MTKINSLKEIYKNIVSCEKCGLCKTRNKAVTFRGNPKSKIMIIGEGPGATEDEKGIPFVGRSGKLLDKMLIEIFLDIEEDIYISNIVKCRPPNNRNPFFDEIQKCQDYILNEIILIKPRLIITLGRVPGDWFARYKEYNIYTFYERKLWLPMYHPSYLLRQSNEKKEEWKNALRKILIKRGLT